MNELIIRQGDVLLVPVDRIRTDAKRIRAQAGRHILAEGEATGHAHAVSAADAHLIRQGGEILLSVLDETDLVHEEHAPIRLVPGGYRVIRQREYVPTPIGMPERSRRVAD